MAATTSTLMDGPKNVVVQLAYDGASDESAVLKVDVSGLSPAPDEVRIDQIWYSTSGLAAQILWDATTDVRAWVCPADDNGYVDFDVMGGLQNISGSGKTGDIRVTTTGASAATDSYVIVLSMTKKFT